MASRDVSRILYPFQGGDHSSRNWVTPILKQPTRPIFIEYFIDEQTEQVWWGLFGLAPRGVCHALYVAIKAVGSYLTFSPLPEEVLKPDQAVYFLWHFP